MAGFNRGVRSFRLPKPSDLRQPRLTIALFFSFAALLLIASRNRPSKQPVITQFDAGNRQTLTPGSCKNLTSSICIPRLGFGTAALGSKKQTLIKYAIRAGYRLFDSASDTGPWYKSEGAVGQAFREAILSTEGLENKKALKSELMVTSKLHPADFTPERLDISLHSSFTNLQEPFIDIYLLHYTGCGPESYKSLCPSRDGSELDYLGIWPYLEEKQAAGKLGTLGVANINLKELEQLMMVAKYRPTLVQTWFDPHHQNWELVRFCKEHNIAFQAYSSLGTQWAHRTETAKTNPILTDPVLLSLASKYAKSVPQIVLRWLLQEDILVIPRSSSEAHIQENIEVFDFELSNLDVESIRALSK